MTHQLHWGDLPEGVEFGSAVAVVVLAIARAALWPRLLEALPFVQLAPNAFNPAMLVGELFLAGATIGVVASWISVGRHLRT